MTEIRTLHGAEKNMRENYAILFYFILSFHVGPTSKRNKKIEKEISMISLTFQRWKKEKEKQKQEKENQKKKRKKRKRFVGFCFCRKKVYAGAIKRGDTQQTGGTTKNENTAEKTSEKIVEKKHEKFCIVIWGFSS